MTVSRITTGPKHHLFGFHDLVQTNAKGDLALALEVDDISHPPLPGESCWFGVVPSGGGQFSPVHTTFTWNYPQGARQQWIGDSDLFTCNDRDEIGEVSAWLADARECKVIQRLPFPVHCLSVDGKNAFWFNYDRVHACLGYGYNPVNSNGVVRVNDCPSDDGIWSGNLTTEERRLLVSICEVAKCGEVKIARTGFPHYLTHLLLSPRNDRLAFLHRYRLPDGGETTRLMTIGVRGEGLRCLAKGALSHFTWISNEKIMIWGSHQPNLYAMRESLWMRVPGFYPGVVIAKALAKKLLCLNSFGSKGRKDSAMARAFLIVTDTEECVREKTAVGILTEDGHPMSNPVRTGLIVNDTYPDSSGYRKLMVYDVGLGIRRDIGSFKMLMDKPDLHTFDSDAVNCGIDERIIRAASFERYVFTKSGFHCDLHPRWSYDGKTIYFDSIHEGTRQIYSVELGEDNA